MMIVSVGPNGKVPINPVMSQFDPRARLCIAGKNGKKMTITPAQSVQYRHHSREHAPLSFDGKTFQIR